MTNKEPSARFRALQAPGEFLILANAWDAGSARLIEDCGAPAIATTSAGLAWSCGYPDGHALPTTRLAQAVEAIARVITVPLSVDSEGGYSDEPKQVAETIVTLARSGAVGINLEDGTGTADLMCAKIDAIKGALARAGLDLFINARIDVLLRKLSSPENAIAETVARAKRYAQAGCDGIFVPRISKPDEIKTVAAAVAPLALNVMAVPGLATAAELRALGARRLSAGGGVARAALSVTRRLAEMFLKEGRSDDLYAEIKDQTNINALFGR
jgi:2-methylisocitrate lyase-like PEP mutase family enzyme